MEKAYDIKALGAAIVAEAKKEGLTIAEDALEKLGKATYVGVKSWLTESAALSENKIDDFAAPFISQLDGIVNPLIEKIDLDQSGS